MNGILMMKTSFKSIFLMMKTSFKVCFSDAQKEAKHRNAFTFNFEEALNHGKPLEAI